MPAETNGGNFNEIDDSCVATQQKAVYTWHESRHSDDKVVNIYSSLWQERTTDWYRWIVDTFGLEAAPVEIVKSWKRLEEIDFRVFFFAHPVATFSLWHVLQAFYEIDEAVCGSASDAQDILAKWQDMKPFDYLKSKVVRRKWEVELKRLNKEIECGDLFGKDLELRMYNVLNGVERLEISLLSLEQDMNVEDGEIDQAEEILTTIRTTIDSRCNLIDKLLKVGKTDADMATAEEEVWDENLASSTDSLEASSMPYRLTSATRSWSFSPPLRRDSFNIQSSDLIYSVLALAFLGLLTLTGGQGAQFILRNYG